MTGGGRPVPASLRGSPPHQARGGAAMRRAQRYWRQCAAIDRSAGGHPGRAWRPPPPPCRAGGGGVPPPPRVGRGVLCHDPAAPYARAEGACGAAPCGVTASRGRQGGRMGCSQHTAAGSGRAMAANAPEWVRPHSAFVAVFSPGTRFCSTAYERAAGRAEEVRRAHKTGTQTAATPDCPIRGSSSAYVAVAR